MNGVIVQLIEGCLVELHIDWLDMMSLCSMYSVIRDVTVVLCAISLCGVVYDVTVWCCI